MEKENLSLPEILFKTITHFVPDFFTFLAAIHDPRSQARITYPIQEVLLIGMLMFLLKIKARRNIKFQFGSSTFIKNIQQIGKKFYPDALLPDTMLCGCTLNNLLKRTSVDEISALRMKIIKSLLRKKALEQFRLNGKYYLFAIDGTGSLTFTKRHCAHCLKKTSNGKTIYYHPVLECKLVAENGLSLSVGTEFIENENEYITKQDCELKAFYRLAGKLKRDFPQLNICLVLDSLYAAEPVFKICKDNHWAHLIVFKKGSMKAVFAEYEKLKQFSPEQKLMITNKKVCQTYSWVNDIEYGNYSLNVAECVEKTGAAQKCFVLLSSMRLNAGNVKEISKGGRCRWKIENQGFNIQKNGGYKLEHAFSINNVAIRNFYLLMQIAHIFNQLMEKGSLLRDNLQNYMGSLKVFSQILWASLHETLIEHAHFVYALRQRIQIRFNTS